MLPIKREIADVAYRRTALVRRNTRCLLEHPACATRVYPAAVPRRTHSQKPLRSGRVIIIRSKGEYVGSVEAPDRERAEAAAIKRFLILSTCLIAVGWER
jgi:hypothetical protein